MSEVRLMPEWYVHLVGDCKAIVTETEFVARYALVEGYHQLGMRILKENDNFARDMIYGEKIVQRVAESLDRSPRLLSYAVQFAKKFPDLDQVPGGKNVSWTKVIREYLPEAKSEDKKIVACRHCPIHCEA